MAGKVQHEIPRLYLRGFLIPNSTGAEQVFVFRRGRQPFTSNIDRAAAESFFYSELSQTGTKTLDDEITDYEERLDALVKQLRALPSGAVADAKVAAEVVAHLVTRNAHFREAAAYGFKRLVAGASEAFNSEEFVRRLLGINGPTVTDTFRKHFSDLLNRNPSIAALGIPPNILEQLAFAAISGGFSTLFEQQQPLIQGLLNDLGNEAKRLAREGHQKALPESIVPAIRVEKLGVFDWRIVGSQDDLILPDCIAIAKEANKEFFPLMMANSDLIELVLLPLTSRTLLMGARDQGCNFDPVDFNQCAAACSHTYFLSASNAAALRSMIDHIGIRSVTVVDFAVDKSLRSFLSAEGR